MKLPQLCALLGIYNISSVFMYLPFFASCRISIVLPRWTICLSSVQYVGHTMKHLLLFLWPVCVL
jgi:hypothetical protein